jgi:beta-lactamase regulating signal transducer with metallopeptidase domain
MDRIPWAEVIVALWCVLILCGIVYCAVMRYRFVRGR